MKTNFDDIPSPEIDKEIVSHNLAMMEKDMKQLSIEESIGGNAGSVIIEGKSYDCAGLNGYADKQTGMILAFGNFQDISPEIIGRGIKFSFIEAINLEMLLVGSKKKVSKIVEFLNANEFSEKGRKNIEAAIHAYNAKYW